MIRKVVDFALTHRLFVAAFGLLLFGAGMFAFHILPIEAYPDVANNYVEVITQWPGISAEQIEQQVTIPLEIALNGGPAQRILCRLQKRRRVSLSDKDARTCNADIRA